MDESQMECMHAMIEGRVQGVGFRYFVIEVALHLGLTGWTRNTYLGQVEVIAEGPRSELDRLLAALHRGPPSAYVTSVSPEWMPATGQFTSFTVKPTV